MNIFGFRPFKGKFNLGNSDDIPENQDGTLIGSIKQIKSDLTDLEIYTIGTFVDISSYTSTYYTTPCDGYAYVSAESGLAQVIIGDVAGHLFGINDQSIFVRKGSKLKYLNTSGVNPYARFYPLSNS